MTVSLAEIFTGTFFAPIGLMEALTAIVVGYVIGGVLFFLVSLASAKTGDSPMQAVARSFGQVGGRAFSLANVVYLTHSAGLAVECNPASESGFGQADSLCYIAHI